MPVTPHVCPNCSYERPCFFDEGEIVSLREDRDGEHSLWTGIVLRVERESEGNVYRVHWGAPAIASGVSKAVAAKHSGAHRREELARFLVPLFEGVAETRIVGDGGKEPIPHRRP